MLHVSFELSAKPNKKPAVIGFPPVLLGVDGGITARLGSVLIGYGHVKYWNMFHQCSSHNFEQLRNNNKKRFASLLKKEFSLRY